MYYLLALFGLFILYVLIGYCRAHAFFLDDICDDPLYDIFCWIPTLKADISEWWRELKLKEKANEKIFRFWLKPFKE